MSKNANRVAAATDGNKQQYSSKDVDDAAVLPFVHCQGTATHVYMISRADESNAHSHYDETDVNFGLRTAEHNTTYVVLAIWPHPPSLTKKWLSLARAAPIVQWPEHCDGHSRY